MVVATAGGLERENWTITSAQLVPSASEEFRWRLQKRVREIPSFMAYASLTLVAWVLGAAGIVSAAAFLFLIAALTEPYNWDVGTAQPMFNWVIGHPLIMLAWGAGAFLLCCAGFMLYGWVDERFDY